MQSHSGALGIVELISNRILSALPENKAINMNISEIAQDAESYKANIDLIKGALAKLNPKAQNEWLLDAENFTGYNENYIKVMQAMVLKKLADEGYIEAPIIEYNLEIPDIGSEKGFLMNLPDGISFLGEDGYYEQKINYRNLFDQNEQNKITSLIADIKAEKMPELIKTLGGANKK